MTDPSPLVLYVRLLPGVVGESQRALHVVPLDEQHVTEDGLVAYCGERIGKRSRHQRPKRVNFQLRHEGRCLHVEVIRPDGGIAVGAWASEAASTAAEEVCRLRRDARARSMPSL